MGAETEPLANRIYGPDAAVTPAPAPAAAQPATVADAIYKNTPKPPRGAALGLGPAFTGTRDRLADGLGLSQAQISTREEGYATLFDQVGLDPYGVGRTVYELQAVADIADARGDVDEVARDRQILADIEETRQRLAGTYGRASSDDLLVRAQKFVKQFPELANLLGRPGIGSRPEVVIPIVEHVRRINYR